MKKIASLIFVICASYLISFSFCGLDYETYADAEYYEIFRQESIADSTLFAFLYHGESEDWEKRPNSYNPKGDFRFYTGDYWPALYTGSYRWSWDKRIDRNISDWLVYLKELGFEPKPQDVRFAVYELKLETMMAFLDGKIPKKRAKDKPDLPTLHENSFLQIWKKRSIKPLVSYLAFAKSCEVFATVNPWEWDETDKRQDQDAMIQLVEEGTKIHEAETDTWLKMRYAYQLVRLARYLGDNELAIEYFDKYVEPLAEKNYIYYRAMEQKAGALYEIGDKTANYYFVNVFHHCPDRRTTCLNSFITVGAEQWEESFKLCQSDEERSAFYAIRAFLKGGFVMEEMENIFKIAPLSPYLEGLLARQINKLEHKMYPRNFRFSWEEGYDYLPPKHYPAYPQKASTEEAATIGRLKKICAQIVEVTESNRRDFWINAQASLALLSQDYKAAQDFAARIPNTSILYQQAEVTGFLARLCALDHIDAEIENELGEIYNQSSTLQKHKNLNSMMFDMLSLLYHRQHEPGKRYLCHGHIYSLRRYPDLEIIEDLLQLPKGDRDITKLEKILLDKAGLYDPVQLKEARGNYFMNRNQFYGVVAEYSKLPKNYYSDFYTITKDQLNHLLREPKLSDKDSTSGCMPKLMPEKRAIFEKITNRKELAQALLELNLAIDQTADTTELAEYIYLAACIWSHNGSFQTETNYSKAFEYCDWLLKNPNVDKELKARACYMGARYTSEDYGDLATYWIHNGIPKLKVEAGERTYTQPKVKKYLSYFNQLEDKLSDTDYYKEVIEECEIFRDYVAKK